MTTIDNPMAITSPRDLPNTFPVSRRERPAKPALTREKIIDAALIIVRDEGIEKVTMRRIAADLDTGPASLYVYVRNTEDLYAQILDALLAPILPVGPSGSWRDRLIALLMSYTNVLFEHPQAVRMSIGTRPSGTNYLAIVESILTLLSEGGVPNRGAAWAVDQLLAFATSAASQGSSEPAGVSALEQAIGSVSGERFPHISALGAELLSGQGSERFVWGLNVIINGVMSTPRPRF